MAETCPHGFAPAECLICRTLGAQPKVQVESSAGRPQPGRARRHQAATSGNGIDLAGAAVRPDAVYAPGTKTRLRPASHHLLVMVGILLAVGAALWLLAGVAFAVIRLLELIVVAAGAGWAGYRVGHWRGRHDRR
jgi:hypothetical protein